MVLERCPFGSSAAWAMCILHSAKYLMSLPPTALMLPLVEFQVYRREGEKKKKSPTLHSRTLIKTAIKLQHFTADLLTQGRRLKGFTVRFAEINHTDE